jgi:hypothetical protein
MALHHQISVAKLPVVAGEITGVFGPGPAMDLPVYWNVQGVWKLIFPCPVAFYRARLGPKSTQETNGIFMLLLQHDS